MLANPEFWNSSVFYSSITLRVTTMIFIELTDKNSFTWTIVITEITNVLHLLFIWKESRRNRLLTLFFLFFFNLSKTFLSIANWLWKILKFKIVSIFSLHSLLDPLDYWTDPLILSAWKPKFTTRIIRNLSWFIIHWTLLNNKFTN